MSVRVSPGADPRLNELWREHRSSREGKAMKLPIQSIYKGISTKRRQERCKLFWSLAGIQQDWKILDVGCGESNRSPWFPPEYDVTGSDLRDIPIEQRAYRKFVCCDSRKMPFANRDFDLVYSNSLIEHLSCRAHQVEFARETMRVGKYYWIQTPNFHFPVDPHYLVPFFHYLPQSIQPELSRRISGTWLLGGFRLTGGFKGRSDYRFQAVNGLTPSDLRELFPDARIIHQRFAGLSQSIVAARLPKLCSSNEFSQLRG